MLFILFSTNIILSQNYIGDYTGIFQQDQIHQADAKAQVVSEGGNGYRLLIKSEDMMIALEGIRINGQVIIFGKMGGYNWHGQIKDSLMVIHGSYGQRFEMQRFDKKSPTEGLKPPKNAIILLPYNSGKKPDMSNWTNQSWEAMENGSMRIVQGTGSSQTKKEFSNIKKLHLEFLLPEEANHLDQCRCNSGLFLNERYEIQILDSYGVLQTAGDCGAIYGHARPNENASFPPNTWQTYDITFTSPKIEENGNVTELPRVTVYHNGVKIHDNVEIPNPTANRNDKHRAKGPISLQHHDIGHLIQFRNIWLIEG